MTSSQKFIVGIDPGLSGAIAFLRPDGFLSVLDMPTTKIKVSGKQRAIIDLNRLVERFDRADIQLVMIEQVSTRPRESCTSALKIGEGFGIIKGAVAANYHKLEVTQPQVWKKQLCVPKDKNAARARASELMPGAAHKWYLVKHDGRAEAAMIALYAAELLGIEIPEVRV